MVTAVKADVQALTDLQTQLSSATSHHDVTNALYQGILVRAVARTQLTVTVRAGAVRNAATARTRPLLAPSAPTPTARSLPVVGLSPDSARTDIHHARKSTDADLADAESTLSTTTGDGGDGGTTTTSQSSDA